MDRGGENDRKEKREDSELISLLAIASLNCPRPPASPFRPRSLPIDSLLLGRVEPEVEQFIAARSFF